MKKKFLSGLLAALFAVGGLPACDFGFGGFNPLDSSQVTASNEDGESSLRESSQKSSSSQKSDDGDSVSSEKTSSSDDTDGVDSSTDSSISTGGDTSDEDSSIGTGGNTQPPEDIVTEDMSIHFLYFDNLVSGDCTLIKVGNTEVLIDAGSTRGSVDVTIPYIQNYCTDGVLEYVVATHAHSDHISGFLGKEEKDREGEEDGWGVFESFECRTIIDYTERETTSALSQAYEAARDKEVADHGGNHYTALECWKNQNGAQRSYTLGEGITMNILYQKYYETSTSNENNYSVCLLITQGENHYLFTGDLESGGEKSLAESNDLPKCKLYKGGHHGSDTSSTNALLSKIQPEIVCVCSCCGDKHNFVKQDFINRIAPYTDKVYITTYKDITADKAKPLNGNIRVSCFSDGSVTVNGSNNNTLFKDTEWFKENRTCPDAWKVATTGE